MQIPGMQVIVVGGATGGSAAALLLARAGAHVTLLERVSRLAAVGAGIAIAANGQAVLESLGLAPALGAARRVTRPRIVDGTGRTLMTPPVDADVRMLRRATLQRVLLDGVAAEPRITARFGAEVLHADPGGHVTVRDASGERALSADLVVAADGVHSRVRDGLRVGARVDSRGIAYLRALVQVPARNEEAWTAAGIFGSFDVDDGTYIYASAGTADTRDAVAACDLDALRSAWRRAYPASGPLLAGVGDWESLIVNRVVTVACEQWCEGRVALLGDAAHAMAPNLGQGANSALVDAAVLLDCLRREADVASALAAYEARRKPAVAYVARLAAQLGALAEEERAIPRWIRDRLLLPVLARIGGDPTPRLLQEDAATLLAIGRA